MLMNSTSSAQTRSRAPEEHRRESAELTGQSEPPAGSVTLWYREPATNWNEALPVGAGRLGAMVYGGVAAERIQINEDTLWEGYPHDPNNPAALQALPEIRKAIFEGRQEDATKLIGSDMMGVPPRIKSYQPLGDLLIDTPDLAAASNYRRDLDLTTGIATTRYTVGDTTFTREVFASYPDNVIVVHIAANHPGKIRARIKLAREAAAEVDMHGENGWGIITLSGQLSAQYVDAAKKPWGPVKPGMRFAGQACVMATGRHAGEWSGVVTIGSDVGTDGADSLTILLAAHTDYQRDGQLGGADPVQHCSADLNKLDSKSYEQLRAAHVADVQSLMNRVELDLGSSPADVRALPTDERLKRLDKQGLTADPAMLVTYFQFGRYLLASCSRPGSMPANLQGNWNDKMNAAWNSDFHTNINIQMNYWPAEVTNLSECHQPLFDFMQALSVPGSETAKVMYDARGWVVHHLTDPFLTTTPCDGPPGVWPMGAAWMCQHAWEHYAFTSDRDFLAKQGYPLMKGAARFILDYMIPAPASTPVAGKLVTCPSYSPENKFITADGKQGFFSYASSMDLEIIHDLLTHCIEATKALNTDDDFRGECEKALANLAPLQIAKDGRLQEWIEDYKEQDPHHRHTSHLFAVYPGDQITLDGTPDLAAAARKSLEARTDEHATEWSFAWRTALWARLGDGDRAFGQLDRLLSKDLYPNLFNKYPPFQIDGNLGATAALCELLVQSQNNELQLLPALPKQWKDGHVKGLCARGGFEVDMTWKDGALTSATITSKAGQPLRLRSNAPLTVTLNGSVSSLNSGVTEFATQINEVCEIRPR
jgi:alpha-L-fucosidase 2